MCVGVGLGCVGAVCVCVCVGGGGVLILMQLQITNCMFGPHGILCLVDETSEWNIYTQKHGDETKQRTQWQEHGVESRSCQPGLLRQQCIIYKPCKYKAHVHV